MEEKLYNLGIIEVMDLSHKGFMSYNRANKIRKDVYGGKPWRLPKSYEIFYFGYLSNDYGLKLLHNDSLYWTNTAFYLSQVYAYSPNKNALSMKPGHAGARLILVRDL
jgi:hypothetical protein